jgi:soluble lytic murein transglycosylase-like protein
MQPAIIALILAVAAEAGIPPNFALAVALTENPGLDAEAVNTNADGSLDRGIMQLNDKWFAGEWQDPEINIRAGCMHIKALSMRGLNWWQVAISYNAGYARLATGKPPDSSIEYANRVLARWQELEGNKWLR